MTDLSGLPPESDRLPQVGYHATGPAASRLSPLSSSSSSSTSSSSPSSPESQPHQERFSSFRQHVNLDLVREMIAQHAIEIMIILVIVIYLAYYFSRISKRPKLIGNRQSPFVAMIKKDFRQTLKSRFSPLIYFWGTNPQTCLFGYLQGNLSTDEVPRSKFHRQFLYVSDAQYLASNIDLSEHYVNYKKRRMMGQFTGSHRLACDQHQHQHKLSNHLDHKHNVQQQQQLQMPASVGIIDATAALEQQQEERIVNGKQQKQQLNANLVRSYATTAEKGESLLKQNIQFVSGGGGDGKHQGRLSRTTSGDCSDSSAIGSSSDSGVFANETTSGSSSSSSSSSSSRSSLTIDMSSVSAPSSRQSKSSSTRSAQSTCSSQASAKCSCSSLYEPPESLLDELQLLDQTPPNHNSRKTPPNGVLGGNKQHQIKREQFEFGQCALDWFVDSHQQYHTNKSVALISAGMTTGSDKKYVTDAVQCLQKLGYEVCVFIRRGVGGLKLNSAKFFSPSKWRDFEAAILSIKRQRPDCRLVAIGFSFGSIELCRYLSMSGTQSLVDSALLISCPFDPEAGGRNMRKRALNRKIDAYLAKNLGKQLHQALSFDDSNASESSSSSSTTSSSSASSSAYEDRTTLEMMSADAGQIQMKQSLKNCMSVSDGSSSCGGKGISSKSSVTAATVTSASSQQVQVNYNGSVVDLSSLPKIKSLVDFEDNYNRVIQHYPNSDAYGADSRLSDQLINISTPTLCISSEDDFMAPVKLLPIKQIEANKNLCMILTKRGGHMAFIDGLVWPKRPYFAQRIISEYMKLPPPPTQLDDHQ